MKTSFFSLSAWIGIGVSSLGVALGANTAAIDEVLKLKSAGVGEDTLIAFVRSRNTAYDLTSDDLIALRDKGLPPTVLNAMLANPGVPSGATPAPARAPIAYPGQSSPPPTLPSVQPAVPVAQPVPTAPVFTSSPPPLNGDAAHFAGELNPYGRWVLGDDGQWFWQPSVVLSSPGWRPYWDAGHWVYTDQGWYWASDYPWGGITFHYGRWQLHARHGWIWLPDRVWGPSWVAWRSGSEYCGWAPLPPGALFDARAGAFLYRGRSVAVGFDFGLDWRHFNFSLVSELGFHPVLRLHSDLERQNVFRQTVVLHGYSAVHSGGSDHFFNHGIEPGRVAAVRGRPVETVRIHDVHTVEPGRSRERMDSHRNRIDVYRR